MRLPPTARWSDDGLQLFLLEPHHATQAYVDWLNDAAVNRYLESRFAVHTIASVRAFVEAALADDDTVFLGIRSLALDRHVGNIKVVIDRHHDRGEVGIVIGDPAASGRGLGSRAIARVVDIATHELGLRKLTAGCYASNRGSARAFEKAGFVVECVRSEYYLLDGQTEDLILMSRKLRGTRS